MKSTTFALGSLLAGIAVAQPHRHNAFHHKRADPPVVWTTEYDYVYETVGVTTTIWVSEGQEVETATAAPATSTAVAESKSDPVPAQFFEPKESQESPAAVPTTSSSSSVYVAPTPTSTYVAPAPATSSSVAPAPVVESSPEPVVVSSSVAAPVTSSAVEVTPTTSVAPAPSSTPASSSSGSSSGYPTGSGSETADCESSGALCGGDLTFYDPVPSSYGACGFLNDGLKERVVALPHELMGTQSNGNPYCGRTITILHNGKKTTAEVVDKCMGCKGRDIDISRLAFDDLDSQDVGRTTATWYFSS